ncbi:hypothetical protein G4G28_00250 [Massilia sp. Dwa41.01b]|uniref:hypothetical protein n=1 Tax=Massilia sp. Dwa41.01b TaxID=2709302 RepID=UPI001603C3BE|nr:hypothetical protein [Massilia sp. Dwa41.01b]QNA87282.1 hypothetical protein G4G28_00250 [Massilia sp. Dwa41.01b]
MPLEGDPPALRLLPLLPSGWTVEQRSAASLWLKHVVVQFGWPAKRVTGSMSTRRMRHRRPCWGSWRRMPRRRM